MNSEQHFDKIAKGYDYWKEKNYYYYRNLVELYRGLIPASASVLEIGCGTGDILARLNPKQGRGTDISGEMIALAQSKYHDHSNLVFEREDIMATKATFSQSFIFLADVLEHISDLPAFLSQLSRRTELDSTVIISVANPLWEPILMAAEKLGQKMPEGPHQRISINRTEEFFREAGFKIQERGYRLLIPKKILGSDWINQKFYRWPTLRHLGFTVFWVLKKADKTV